MDNARWAMTDHACRHCLGRILRSGTTFRCSVCEVEGRGEAESICGCGIKVAGRSGTQADMGFRCAPNPKRSPTSPAVTIIEFGPPAFCSTTDA
jgi:hypothetical protein